LLKVIPFILDFYIKAPNNLPTTSTFHKITIRKKKGQGTYQKSCIIDTPPSSLMDSTMSAKVKTSEGEGVGAHSLACNISGVEGHVGVQG
jgi:hypothetical protein